MIYTNMTSLITAWIKLTFLERLLLATHVSVPHMQRTHRVYHQTFHLHLYPSPHPALELAPPSGLRSLVDDPLTAFLEWRWTQQGHTQERGQSYGAAVSHSLHHALGAAYMHSTRKLLISFLTMAQRMPKIITTRLHCIFLHLPSFPHLSNLLIPTVHWRPYHWVQDILLRALLMLQF
jgi:hypothetical protein